MNWGITLPEGTKFDKQKYRYDLIAPEALDGLAQVLTIGANKYNARNWEQGMSWGRVFAAMMRHAWKWWGGETYDKEDGQHHLSSVMWCAMVLYTYEIRKVGTDDRREGATQTKTAAEGESPCA